MAQELLKDGMNGTSSMKTLVIQQSGLGKVFAAGLPAQVAVTSRAFERLLRCWSVTSSIGFRRLPGGALQLS